MPSGVIVGVLKKQHADHLVLSDSTRLRLAEGLIVEEFGAGTRVTITYSRDGDGEMIVESITRTEGPPPRPDSLL